MLLVYSCQQPHPVDSTTDMKTVFKLALFNKPLIWGLSEPAHILPIVPVIFRLLFFFPYKTEAFRF